MKRLLEAGAAIDKKDKVRTGGFNSNWHSPVNPQRQSNSAVCVSAGGHSRSLGLQRRQPARPAAPPRPGSQDHLQRQGRSSQTKAHEGDTCSLCLYVLLCLRLNKLFWRFWKCFSTFSARTWCFGVVAWSPGGRNEWTEFNRIVLLESKTAARMETSFCYFCSYTGPVQNIELPLLLSFFRAFSSSNKQNAVHPEVYRWQS